MKNVLLIALLSAIISFDLQAQASTTPEYKVVTVVESIVPAGIGRSRIIESQTDMNADQFTTERTDGKKSDQGKIKRKDAKIDEFSETKLLNLFSITGINFQNIASNDAMITSRINELAQDGWELMFMSTGVESHAGEPDDHGIYITRFIFKR